MGVTPRKVADCLQFIEQFEKLLKRWPADKKWALTEIAEQASTPLPQVVEFLCESIENTFDIHNPISYKDADHSLVLLRQRMHTEIENERRRVEKQKALALMALESTMEKVRVLQTGKNWYGAFRTLTYFAGVHEKNLKVEHLASLYNDCLRLGVKAKVNFQELARWLQKGVEVIITNHKDTTLDDALDFIDAYAEYFVSDESNKGQAFISAMLTRINAQTTNIDTTTRINNFLLELNLPTMNIATGRMI